VNTVLVTGANRGLGLEFARQYAAEGWRVVAACRDPGAAGELNRLAAESDGRIAVIALDVSDLASVRAAAQSLAGAPVDLLINNAGVYGGNHQSLGDLDIDDAIATFNTNALGALRVTFALLPAIRAGEGRKIVHLTSGMGSIADNTSGGFYAYRMSKAALNMASMSLARDLSREKIVSVVINPGWVKTDMGGAGASTPVNESVQKMLAIIDAITPESSGHFLNWRGGEYPW
jgi:NAD(P)-dependent dehydrogenase (short-subunit alcohol dehydrogenase family)